MGADEKIMKKEKPLITYQTGPNESYLIGTKDQLLNFANSIIDSVNSAKTDKFLGVDVLVNNIISTELDSKAEIQIDEVIVVENDKLKNELFYKIYNS